jgi:hypothetical protein
LQKIGYGSVQCCGARVRLRKCEVATEAEIVCLSG